MNDYLLNARPFSIGPGGRILDNKGLPVVVNEEFVGMLIGVVNSMNAKTYTDDRGLIKLKNDYEALSETHRVLHKELEELKQSHRIEVYKTIINTCIEKASSLQGGHDVAKNIVGKFSKEILNKTDGRS